MEANGYFKAESPISGDSDQTASVVFYSPIAGGIYVAEGLSNSEARILAINLNKTLRSKKSREE